jgi:hypothetical protein
MNCPRRVKQKLPIYQESLCFKLVIITCLLILDVRVSSTHQVKGNSEFYSSGSEFSVIDNDCTIVNIALGSRERNYVEANMESQFQSAHEVWEQHILRKSSGNTRILLYMNHSGLNNFQKLNKRPTLQKARKNCVQAILNLPNSKEQQIHRTLETLNFLKEKLIPMNNNPILLVPNQDRLLILAGSREILYSTFNTTFCYSFKYKAGLVLSESSSIYFAQCTFCKKSKQTFQLSSSEELWKDYESNMNHHSLKLMASLTTRPRFNYTLIEGSSSLYRPTTGLLVPFLAFLQQKLNFTYTLQSIGTPGTELPNGSWTGVVGEILKGKIDIAICIGQTFRRAAVAEFSPTIFYEPVALITGHPKKIFVWYAIFWPMSPKVWALICLSSGLSVLVVFFLVKNHRIRSSKGSDQLFAWKIGRILEYIGGSFLGQFGSFPSGRQELPPKIKMFLIVWLFFSFLVSTYYLSILVGFLTFPVLENIPETGEELAANKKFKIGLTYLGGALSTLMRTSKVPMMKNLAGRMELNDGFSCVRSTITEKKVCIGYEILAKVFANTEVLLSNEGKRQKPPVQIHRHYLFSVAAGFQMPKGSVLAPNVADTVRAAISAGLVAEWERQDFRNLRLRVLSKRKRIVDLKSASARNDDNNDETLMSFKHLQGAFLILVGGLTVSSVCMVVEAILWGIRHRQKLRLKTLAVATIVTARINGISMRLKQRTVFHADG